MQRGIDETQSLSDERHVVAFIEEIPKRKRGSCRSALRAHAAEIGIQSPKRIGASMEIKRNAPSEKKIADINAKQADAIRVLIAARMYTDITRFSILSLIVSGVTPSYVCSLKCSSITEGIDGSEIYYLVPSRMSGKMVIVRGVCAKALKAKLDQSRMSGSIFLFSGPRQRPYGRQSIYKMIDSTGVFGIPGVNGTNIVGSLKKEVAVSEGKKPISSREEAASAIGATMGRRAIYDPGTGKMKLLIGGEQWIETELHKSFVEDLKKQGFDNVSESKVKPSERIQQAASQVCVERVEMATKIAASVSTLADLNPDQSMNVISQSIRECASRIGSDPAAMVDLIDQVMASIILQRALILSGTWVPAP